MPLIGNHNPNEEPNGFSQLGRPWVDRLSRPLDGCSKVWFGLREVVLLISGVLLVAWSARVQFPVSPMPVTLQSLMVLLLGGILGTIRGGVTMATYWLAGIAGLPVFASGTGIAYALGPTGGYLLGFVLAAVWVGSRAQIDAFRTMSSSLIVAFIGTTAIMLPGVIWLSLHSGSLAQGLERGFWPHIPGAISKSVFAAGLLYGLNRMVVPRKA